MTWDRVFKWAAGLAGAVLGLFGEWTQMHRILVVLMAVDYLTGWLVALCGKSPKTESGGLSSKIGFIGLAKKGVIMLVVLIATQLDNALGNAAMMFRDAAIAYYIANEGLSVLENAGLLGVPFPAPLKKALESMREKGDKDENKEE